jgi:hypothetical protein
MQFSYVEGKHHVLVQAIHKGQVVADRLWKTLEDLGYDKTEALTHQKDLRDLISLKEECKAVEEKLRRLIEHNQKKSDLKSFAERIDGILSGGKSNWVLSVTERQLAEMGGDANRLYQILTEGKTASSLMTKDLQALRDASQRSDLFSERQCQTLAERAGLERIFARKAENSMEGAAELQPGASQNWKQMTAKDVAPEWHDVVKTKRNRVANSNQAITNMAVSDDKHLKRYVGKRNSPITKETIFWIPFEFSGAMIGNSGSVITSIAKKTGARMYVDKSTWKQGSVAVRMEGSSKQLEDAFEECYSVVERDRRLSPAKKNEVAAMNSMKKTSPSLPKSIAAAGAKKVTGSLTKNLAPSCTETSQRMADPDHLPLQPVTMNKIQETITPTGNSSTQQTSAVWKSELKVNSAVDDQKKSNIAASGLDLGSSKSFPVIEVPTNHSNVVPARREGSNLATNSIFVKEASIEDKTSTAVPSDHQFVSAFTPYQRTSSPTQSDECSSFRQCASDLLVFLRRQASCLKSSPEYLLRVLEQKGVTSISDLKYSINNKSFELELTAECVDKSKWATFMSVVKFESLSSHKWNLECPLSSKLMENPVLAADGFTYERNAIEEWFQKFGGDQVISPKTNMPMMNLFLIPNDEVREMARYMRESSLGP